MGKGSALLRGGGVAKRRKLEWKHQDHKLQIGTILKLQTS
jgi:hypothetical protein